MAFSRYRRYIRSSFLGLLGILVGGAVLVFTISPRRDPSFIPTSSNAGSQLAWAATIPEAVWMHGIMVLAVALAVSIVLLLYSMPSAHWRVVHDSRGSILARLTVGIAASIICVGCGYLLWFGMLWYLLAQSIID